MDYIYEDLYGKKHIGRIEKLDIRAEYEFQLRIGHQKLHCLIRHGKIEWILHIVNLNITAELADPSDVLWNTESIFEVIDDVKICKQLACAVRAVYEKQPLYPL